MVGEAVVLAGHYRRPILFTSGFPLFSSKVPTPFRKTTVLGPCGNSPLPAVLNGGSSIGELPAL
jgi:hypothetical protein